MPDDGERSASGNFFLGEGYVERAGSPEYFVDDNLNEVWQPDVYPDAGALASRLDAEQIVDVGCGTAAKLAALHPRFRIVGIDYGTNIEEARERYPFGTWIDADLDEEGPLPLLDLTGAVLVCADVIEHLVRPERLLHKLHGAIEGGAAAILVSTPDRELSFGPNDKGPPQNPAHVREWTSAELERFMAAEGLEGHFGLTRSNDAMPYLRTILAVIPGREPRVRTIVSDWFEERRKWQRLAEDHDRVLHEREAWIAELRAGNDWLNEHRQNWQNEAEAALAALASLEAGAEKQGRLVEEQGRLIEEQREQLAQLERLETNPWTKLGRRLHVVEESAANGGPVP